MRGYRSSELFIASMLVFGSLALGGCASEPTIDTGPDAEVSFDGLYKIKGGTADEAWARPDTDISQYSKIMLQGVGIQYRPGGDARKTYSPNSIRDHFELTEKQKERFAALVTTIAREELGRSKQFTLVEEPGPDVLLIQGGLLDVVSYVPPDNIGRGEIYLSRVGEATLVLEISDSMTETVLARAVDRRAAEDQTGLSRSNRASNTSEVRRMIRFWARTLRERLDEFKGAAEKE